MERFWNSRICPLPVEVVDVTAHLVAIRSSSGLGHRGGRPAGGMSMQETENRKAGTGFQCKPGTDFKIAVP